MRLADFITANLESILVDWVAFARSQVIGSEYLDEAALLDHGKLILQEIATDMQSPQREEERKAKSEGNSLTASTSRDLPSRSHARQRERQGFGVEQMVSEYRALRATVLRLWSASARVTRVEDLEDVARFNESVDQAVAESLTAFMVEVTKTRDLFLGILGHDLRGPLSTIGNCATALRKGADKPKSVDMILRSVVQMRALLDDLMDYTRNRLGAEITIVPAPLQLDVFARETLDEIRAIDGSCVIELKTQGMMQGEWDARRLHQALSNLVFNALKYGFGNEPIRVGLDGSHPSQVLLTVHNEGRPIPTDLLPRIFEPLVRVEDKQGQDDSRAGANLGLGLFVVQQIATAHGGSVTVTSLDSSTRFELRLPRICRRRSGG
jgi:signal transduction histidine kinase